MADRNEYLASVVINGRQLSKVIIDHQHYRENHPEMDDQLILKLVNEISGSNFDIEKENNGFQYFRVEPVVLDERPYRLCS